jgi:hypothetical protein
MKSFKTVILIKHYAEDEVASKFAERKIRERLTGCGKYQNKHQHQLQRSFLHFCFFFFFLYFNFFFLL